MDAFDTDVLIYAASGNPLGRAVRALFASASEQGISAGIGSVLLVPETLIKPLRMRITSEYTELQELLIHLDLIATDAQIAHLGTTLGATYGLRALDAIHLATAVNAGADRFITNNRSDFTAEITEIDVVYPDQLA